MKKFDKPQNKLTSSVKKTKVLTSSDNPNNKVKRNKCPFIVKKIVWRIVTIIFLLLILIGLFFYGKYLLTKITYEKKSAMVSKQIVQCAELCTISSHYSDVVSIKKSAVLGLARSYSIVRFKGVVRAGIKNISEIDIKISKDGKELSVVLPSSILLSNDISSFEVFDEYQNLFVPIETAEVFDEIQKARDSASREILSEGFLMEADTHAVKLMTEFFSAMGFNKVSVYVWPRWDLADALVK